MNELDRPSPGISARTSKHKLSRESVLLIGDLLPIADFSAVLLAAYLAALACSQWFIAATPLPDIWHAALRASLAGAALTPLMLYDHLCASRAAAGQTGALMRFYILRFLMGSVAVAAIAIVSRTSARLPGTWFALWWLGSLLLTISARLLLIGSLRRLQRSGVLAETVAVVGAGPVADRLIDQLLQTRGSGVEVLGVFDDRISRRDSCVHRVSGSVADLVELGKSRSLDWILLALPGSSEPRLQSLVQHMKALSVPIGLCPQNVGLAAALPTPRFINDELPVTLLAERPRSAWQARVAALETVLPRWIVTLLGLPLLALQLTFTALRKVTRRRKPKLRCVLDNYDLEHFVDVAARFGQERFAYVVTPNVDHLIRLHREPSFRALYGDAAYVLLDSRFVARLLQFTRHLRLPVCTGSDLTAALFDTVIQHDDRLVLIGGSEEQAACLRRRYSLIHLAHFNPPMGFIHDPSAVADCLRFIEAHSPFRYCLLAVGAPQQEMLAQALQARGIARGMALCIGASINFLTGDEQRAPLWMQRHAMEWLFRLLQAPGRMAGRYLLRGPKIFGLLRHTEIVQRSGGNLPAERKASIAAPRSPAAAGSAPVPSRRVAEHS